MNVVEFTIETVVLQGWYKKRPAMYPKVLKMFRAEVSGVEGIQLLVGGDGTTQHSCMNEFLGQSYPASDLATRQ